MAAVISQYCMWSVATADATLEFALDTALEAEIYGFSIWYRGRPRVGFVSF